jgi:histidinol-phosphate aminotransferase
MTLAPRPGVLDIAPYVGGKATVEGVAEAVKLSSNESALGPSPLAVAAYEKAAKSMWIYPEGSSQFLREAIGAHFGLDPARIVCGNGSNELLSLLAHAYVNPGEEVLFSEYGFIVYRLAALSNSGIPVAAPEKNLRTDVDAMLAAVTPRTRIVYLANPNNPTGSYLTPAEVRRLHAGLSPETLLVIDSAYAEYIHRDDYEDGAELAGRYPNVVMTRTFSKVYALAGLRVGWAWCPPAVADVLHRIRDPFNVSVPSQVAAVAALKDKEHVARSVAHNDKWLPWITQEVRKTGLTVHDSVGNFVLIQFPKTPGKTAAEADKFLSQRGLILRGVANYNLPDCLRLTVGPEEPVRRVAAALAEFMARR